MEEARRKTTFPPADLLQSTQSSTSRNVVAIHLARLLLSLLPTPRPPLLLPEDFLRPPPYLSTPVPLKDQQGQKKSQRKVCLRSATERKRLIRKRKLPINQPSSLPPSPLELWGVRRDLDLQIQTGGGGTDLEWWYKRCRQRKQRGFRRRGVCFSRSAPRGDVGTRLKRQ